jgi:hypothetical protein
MIYKAKFINGEMYLKSQLDGYVVSYRDYMKNREEGEVIKVSLEGETHKSDFDFDGPIVKVTT